MREWLWPGSWSGLGAEEKLIFVAPTASVYSYQKWLPEKEEDMVVPDCYNFLKEWKAPYVRGLPMSLKPCLSIVSFSFFCFQWKLSCVIILPEGTWARACFGWVTSSWGFHLNLQKQSYLTNLGWIIGMCSQTVIVRCVMLTGENTYKILAWRMKNFNFVPPKMYQFCN